MADVVRANGWLEEVNDQDWFTVTLTAGQRYYIELLGGALGDQRAVVNTYLPSGAEGVRGWWMTGGRFDSPAYAFVAPVSGTYSIQVLPTPTTVGADPMLPVPYSLSVSAIAADAQGGLPTNPTVLAIGTPFGGAFDLPGDVDAYAVDLAAGQRVVFEASAGGITSIPFRASLLGPGGAATGIETFNSTGSQVKFAFTAPAAGRYTLSLLQRDSSGTAAAPGASAYTVQVSNAAADDRPDGASTALAIGSSINGALDLPGDVDLYTVTLEAGKRYEFDLLPPVTALAGWVSLKLVDAAGNVLRTGSPEPGRFAGMSFEPDTSGSYTLRVEALPGLRAASLSDGGYVLETRQLGNDDFSSRFAAAATITPDIPVTLRLDTNSDVDVFRFNATAGQRFVATLTNSNGVAANATLEIVPNAAALPSQLNVWGFDVRPAGSAYAAAEGSGSMYVAVTPRPQSIDPGASYTLTLSAMAPDDHADVRALGTLLHSGSVVNGTLDLRNDVDWFRADLVAGTRYRFEIFVSDEDRARGVQPELALVDASGRDPLADATGSLLPESRFVFTPTTSGTYYLKPGFVLNYQIGMQQLPADDQSDTRPGSTNLLVNGSYATSGLVVQGTAAAENLVGTSIVDDLRGGGGNDTFFGGAGNDRLDGGTGVDVARVSGRRTEYTLTREGDAWRIADQFNRDGTDTATTIERIHFTGEGLSLALDLNGNAGMVAKTIGAVFGKAYLQQQDIVGIGLDLMDDGMSYANLVSLAVSTHLFQQLAGGPGNQEFVQFVFNNVVGRAPTSSELVFWIEQLNNGAYTQASLALAAAETGANIANIDLAGLAATGIPYMPV